MNHLLGEFHFRWLKNSIIEIAKAVTNHLMDRKATSMLVTDVGDEMCW